MSVTYLCLHTCMSKYVQLMFSVQVATYSLSNVQTLVNVVRTLMYPFRCSFLICPAGWHTSLISISLSSLALSTQCPRLPDRAGGRCRSCRRLPAAAGASSPCAGVAPGRTAAPAPAAASAASTPSLQVSSSWSLNWRLTLLVLWQPLAP